MNKKLYSKYTDESFTDAQHFQDFLHSGNKLKYDYVIVAGILYSMEEYDMDGKTVLWANKKHNMQMIVDTSNRYGSLGYTDAKVEIYPANGLRTDIFYAE